MAASKRTSPAQSYGLAVLLVALAGGLTMLINPLTDRSHFALFYAAVMLSTWFGGLGPGLLATALSALGGHYFFTNPDFFPPFSLEEVTRIVVFVLVALLISSLTAARKRAEAALAKELAHRSAAAEENARLYKAEQQARRATEETNEWLANLQVVTAALSAALSQAQVTGSVIQHGLTFLRANGGVILLLNEPEASLEVIDYFGYSPDLVSPWRAIPLSISTPLTEAVRTTSPVFVESAADLYRSYSEMSRRPAATEHQAWVALPLNLEGRAIGVIGMTFTTVRSFSEGARAYLLALAYQCAQALERARLYEVEQQARAEAEVAQQRLALLAEMSERNRLAQELHDTVAQALGFLNLKISMTNALLDSNQLEEAQANFKELKQVISETYTDVREEIFYLRAKGLSDLGFMELLTRYVDKYRRFYKLDIQMVQEADPALFRFSPEMTQQVVRAVQEALINVRKHAQVDTAIIRLAQEPGHLRISIEDQGQGFEPATLPEKPQSFGLQMMHERIESIGGSVEIDSAPNQGTSVVLRFRQA